MKLESHYGPVTAVCVVPNLNLILSGLGPVLELYDSSKKTQLFSKKAFTANKIHGIAVSESSVLIYGGRSVSLIPLKAIFENQCILEFEKAANDWIVAADFEYGSSSDYFLLTAHNIVISCSHNKVKETKTISEKSILYSGNFTVLQNEVLVFAGTVMLGIFVWRFSHGKHTEKLLHHLEGHEGLIFCVQADSEGKWLASCSDDRSIKIWDLATGENTATGWGHSARIWSLSFYNGHKNVSSASEDCTVRLWSTSEMRCEKVVEAFLGKSAWCSSVSGNLGAAGGNDGRVRVLDLSEETPYFPNFSLDPKTSESNEVVKGVVCITEECFIAISSYGKLFRISTDNVTKVETEIDLSPFSNGFFHISDVSLSSGGFLVFLTSSTGYQAILSFDSHCQLETVATYTHSGLSKITGVFHGHVTEEDLYFLIESPNPKDPFLYVQFNTKSCTYTKTVHLEKPQPRFPVTSHCFHEGILYLGSRNATFCAYSPEYGLLQTWKNIYPGDTISQLVSLKNGVWLTLRDGAYFLLEISRNSGTDKIVRGLDNSKGMLSVKVLCQNRVAKGGFLEGISDENDVVLHGFRSERFYVYNETKNYEVYATICGGSHRFWRYQKDFFFFVRDSVLITKRLTSPGASLGYVLGAGTHGREIRGIAISPKPLDDANTRIVMTGAEDNTIKFSTLSGTSVSPCWTQRRHVSGLQTVGFLNGEYAASCAAREEFLIWRINKFGDSYLVSWHDLLPPASAHPDLRIMDFASFAISKTEMVIALVYLNSCVKMYKYDVESRCFTGLLEWFYKDICLLQCEFIRGKKTHLVITATDGHLIVYDVTGVITGSLTGIPSSLAVIHQNGIKAMCIARKTENTAEVITGGDDNALCKVVITFDDTGSISGLNVAWNIENAASSTITDMCMISENEVLVSSVDQIVRVWDINGSLLDRVYTTVADTGACAASEGIFLVGGLGLSVITR